MEFRWNFWSLTKLPIWRQNIWFFEDLQWRWRCWSFDELFGSCRRIIVNFLLSISRKKKEKKKETVCNSQQTPLKYENDDLCANQIEPSDRIQWKTISNLKIKKKSFERRETFTKVFIVDGQKIVQSIVKRTNKPEFPVDLKQRPNWTLFNPRIELKWCNQRQQSYLKFREAIVNIANFSISISR